MQVFCTSFCNQMHDMATGKPVEHECCILPPRALRAERAGDVQAAIAILMFEKGPVHSGVRLAEN